MLRLLAVLILLPLLELLILLRIGRQIGLGPTVGIMLFTGVVGALLARAQGLGVLKEIQNALRRGELPTGKLIDGLIILLAGAVLLMPGVLTDVLGFFCLVPAMRRRLRDRLASWLQLKFATPAGKPSSQSGMVDIQAVEVSPDAGPDSDTTQIKSGKG